MTTIPTFRIGEWVGVNGAGIWICGHNETIASWKTRKEVVDEISCSYLDSRRRPKVNRNGQGDYTYTVKHCDTNRFGEQFSIIRLTSENIEEYRQLLKEQLADE